MKYFLTILAVLLVGGWTAGAFALPVHEAKEKGKIELSSAKQAEAPEEKERADAEESGEAEEGAPARTAKITLQEAIQTALARVPGSVEEATLEGEDRSLLYEVAIVGADRSRTEVQVDAQSGQVLKIGKGEIEKEREEENEG